MTRPQILHTSPAALEISHKTGNQESIPQQVPESDDAHGLVRVVVSSGRRMSNPVTIWVE